MIRWSYPFPWYYAWQSYAYARGTVEPARSWARCELLAEIRCKMIAVIGEEIIGGPLELLRSLKLKR
jgi:hypothetical protein